jgi:phytoene dehydrogenase-like protein
LDAKDTSAVVVGAGPNGLAAAIELARTGRRVVVHEAAEEIGGGTRSAELTLPGFVHDICSAVHPLAAASPCFERYPLARHGLEWIHPEAPLAHPFDDGSAVVLERSLDATCAQLGLDGAAWRRLFEPLAANWDRLRRDVLAPARFPRAPWLMARFGFQAIRPARELAEDLFRGPRVRALFAGLAAHSSLPLEARPSAAFGLVLGALAHTVGWPIPRGGAQRIAGALAGYLRELGGEIRTGSCIVELPAASVVICDIGPRGLLALGRGRWPARFRRALERYRYGPGAFKVDWALSGPIPWRAAPCRRAATVHLGGTLEEIAMWEARHTGRPFVLLVQPSLFDAARAPSGGHTAWAYCHVPNGSGADMTDAIEAQVERFAPGFRGLILARHVLGPAALERHNPNLVGGDINGGAADLRQIFLRPTRHLYRTPIEGIYLCSAATPPGGGVHGMCGYHAAAVACKALGRSCPESELS